MPKKHTHKARPRFSPRKPFSQAPNSASFTNSPAQPDSSGSGGLGLGALTAQVLDREIGDWERFKNRRQVASYTGLVPCEDSSGERRFRGAITKHGNPRVRHILIEASWRLQQFQPEYKAVQQRRATLAEARAKNHKAAKKKLCVGLARQFIVDWWRIRTGRTTPEKLGLQMSWPAAYVLRGKAPAKPAASPPTPAAAPAAA